MAIIASLASDSSSDYLLPVSMDLSDDTKNVYRALVDTGALNSDYCSHAVGEELVRHGIAPIPCMTRVGSALGSSEVAKRKFCISIILKNELTSRNEILPLVVTEIDIEYDLIIGRPSIQKYGLLEKLKEHLTGTARQLESPVVPPTASTRRQPDSHQA